MRLSHFPWANDIIKDNFLLFSANAHIWYGVQAILSLNAKSF